MKVWNSFSSEHSAALVMIGHFKTADDATVFLAELNKLEDLIAKAIPDYEKQDSFPKEIMDALFHEDIKFGYDLSPKDLDDFLMEHHISKVDGDGCAIQMTSDDTGWAGLIKMMINAGARVEIFSSHNERKDDA